MSDNWGHYFADMAGHYASILFDDGISGEVDQLAYTFSLKLRVELQNPTANGLTTSEEADRLNTLEDSVQAIVASHGGVLLGRVTTNGTRWILGLVSSEAIEGEVAAAIVNAGYQGEVSITSDPTKSVYWDDLYPDADSRQVLNDMLVLQALSKEGDVPEVARPVRHWTYFVKRENAEAFCSWLDEHGYQHDGLQKEGTILRRKWLVQSHHECTMRLNDITHHTLAHFRQARALVGEYDGWETSVEKKQES